MLVDAEGRHSKPRPGSRLLREFPGHPDAPGTPPRRDGTSAAMQSKGIPGGGARHFCAAGSRSCQRGSPPSRRGKRP
eukprot:6776104-Pyramimonas_sp.AAC.1